VIDVLRPGQAGTYLLTAGALEGLAQAGLSARVRAQVAQWPRDQAVDQTTLDGWLAALQLAVGPGSANSSRRSRPGRRTRRRRSCRWWRCWYAMMLPSWPG